MYLGMKHFRMPKDTLRVNADAANPLSDDELRSLPMPVLLLFGDGEVIYGSAEALERARRLIPHVEGDLVPGCRHDMCLSQSRIVDARVLDFLKDRLSFSPGEVTEELQVAAPLLPRVRGAQT
jgi:pimeloyl-ACP methyl ester carboxylesterase